MGLINNKKSEEERMREQAAIKDSMNTASIEQQALAEKQKDSSSNKIFNIKEARQRIKETLLGYKTTYNKYKDQNGKVKTETEKIDENPRKLCNRAGAGIFLDEAKTFLNLNTITSYLPPETIENKGKATLKPIYKQIVFYHPWYEIPSTTDAGNIISTIRSPMIDAMNKASDGRLIKSQEKVRVEKESVSREGSADDNDSSSSGDLF